MNELKEALLHLFKKERRYYTRRDLRKITQTKGEEKTELLDTALSELESDGYIFLEENKGYTLFEYNRRGLAFGTIEINKDGNGYVHTKDGFKIFIKNANLNGALTGDNVIVSDISPKSSIYKGEIYKITKRGNSKAVFKVKGSGKDATLIPYNNNYNINIPIELSKNDRTSLLDGQIIAVDLPTNAYYGTFVGSYVKVLGYQSDPTTDLKVLAEELGVDYEFTEEEMKQANSIPREVRPEDTIGRVDLRGKNFFTIDCDGTKDRDDAVCVEKLPNGNKKLYVAIASVNHYIKMGTPLYEGIKRRNTSHYPNDTVFPMLPHILSNGICSLNANVDRLVKVCEMEIDNKGQVVNSEVYNAVINSRKEMCYSKVNELLEGNEVPEYEEFKDELKDMQSLSDILSAASKRRQYLEFDIPEISVSNDNGQNTFKERKQGISEKMIENFMVITDNTVALKFAWLPIIYRVHENPNDELVKQAVERLKLAGVNIRIPDYVDVSFLKRLLKLIDENEELKEYNTVLLKSMAKAKYSIDNVGHYALQLDFYCHFTSPIRRAADFLFHTIIDEAEKCGYDPETIKQLESEAFEVAGKASAAERLDKKFESEARKMAMAEEMENHINEEFSGRVIDVFDRGMYVRLDSLIDGRIALDDIARNAYYDKEIDAVVVPGKNEYYRIGKNVDIRVKDASKENRTIDFVLVRKKVK